MYKIAVFGSAFNPPHRGHMDVIEQLKPKFDKVLLVPTAAHAFGKNTANIELRKQLLDLILDDYFPNDNKVEVSLVEFDMQAESTEDKPVYSYDLLNHLNQQSPAEYHLIIGPDNAAPETWQKFYKHEEIKNEFALTIVEERRKVRSTEIRELLNQIEDDKAKRSLHNKLENFVGKSQCKYIIENLDTIIEQVLRT